MASRPLPAPPTTLPPAPDPVEIDLGDGKKRILRYTVRSLQRLKAKLGHRMIGPNAGLQDLDESLLPELIFEGLRVGDAEPDVTIDQIVDMPTNALPYLLHCFVRAYSGSLPEKKDAAPESQPAATNLPTQ